MMLLPSLLLIVAVTQAYEITYDQHSFLINGKRTLIFGGSFHYPRASTAEWPVILKLMKEQGLNLVQTYVEALVRKPAEDFCRETKRQAVSKTCRERHIVIATHLISI